MFDIGWVEMMIVVVVMIVVIGPKDLPVVLHTMGKWIAHVRAMARGFQDSIEEMAQESGLDQMRDEVRSIRDFSLDEKIEKTIDPEGELKESLSGDLVEPAARDETDAAESREKIESPESTGPGDSGDLPSTDKAADPGTDSDAPAREKKG